MVADARVPVCVIPYMYVVHVVSGSMCCSSAGDMAELLRPEDVRGCVSLTHAV